MELDQLARRVLRRHLFAVVLGVATGLALGVFAALGQGGYVARATVAVTSDVPSTEVESRALVEGARALATSRAVVRSALDAAGIRADVEAAARDVRVEAVGTSAMVRLEVRRSRAAAAQRLAEALATKLVKRLDAAAAAAVEERVTQLLQQEKALKVGGSSDELTAIRLERLRLESLVASRPRASVVSRPALPSGLDVRGLALTTVRWAGLGLLVGLLLAGLLEVVRPGLVGLGAVARALSVPSLGTPAGWLRGGDLSEVARRMRLLAAARGADTVVVIPLRQAPDTAVVVGKLRAAVLEDTPATLPAAVDLRSPLMLGRDEVGGTLLAPLTRTDDPAPRTPLRLCTLSELQPETATGAVAVLVTPSSVSRRELEDVLDLCSATGVVLAAVIGRPRVAAPGPG